MNKESAMTASITTQEFTVTLVTIHSSKTFSQVTQEIESMFNEYDLPTLAALTAKGDRAAVEDFVARTAGDREFSIFFKLDQGSTQRLAGIPIESRFYLLGNATIAEGLFKYSPVAGLGAPVRICVSQRDGETTRIDLDQPTSFFSQIPELKASDVPALLDEKMIGYLREAASGLVFVCWPVLGPPIAYMVR